MLFLWNTHIFERSTIYGHYHPLSICLITGRYHIFFVELKSLSNKHMSIIRLPGHLRGWLRLHGPDIRADIRAWNPGKMIDKYWAKGNLCQHLQQGKPYSLGTSARNGWDWDVHIVFSSSPWFLDKSTSKSSFGIIITYYNQWELLGIDINNSNYIYHQLVTKTNCWNKRPEKNLSVLHLKWVLRDPKNPHTWSTSVPSTQPRTRCKSDALLF